MQSTPHRPWLWWTHPDIAVEREQLKDECRLDPAFAAELAEIEALPADSTELQDRFNALLDRAAKAASPGAADEPSDLIAIREARPGGPRTLPFDDSRLQDRLHGAWLGRCAGCLLGKPIEGMRTDRLWGLLNDGGHDMLTDYLWRMDIPPRAFADREAAGILDFGAGVRHMPEDDDTNYTAAGLALIKQHGTGFAPYDVASFWLQNLPILHTFTAERVAYRNFVDGILPPGSAVHRNPYREWIGAQIRGDFYGYVAPGKPELAAELAWRDASVSHIRNGIYGEMWVSAMIAAAAAESSVQTIIETGLSEIPAQSRLTAAVRRVLQQHAEGLPYREAVSGAHRRWDERSHHHWCHTISNAEIVTIGLLYGEGDLEKTITRAVYPGFDTDCNGATAGSIVGMVLGAAALPAKWTGVMNDTLHTGVAGYHVVSISGMAEETLKLRDSNS